MKFVLKFYKTPKYRPSYESRYWQASRDKSKIQGLGSGVPMALRVAVELQQGILILANLSVKTLES